MKNIDDFINNGFREDFPIYYNNISIVDYNLKKNQNISCKRVGLNKYKLNGFIANKCYKFLTKISNRI